MPPKDLLTRVRAICRALPDTEESSRLGGSPHFYVGGKIFAGCGAEDGTWGVGVKVGLELQAVLIERPGIRVAKYVGRYGWVQIDEAALESEAELAELIRLSYGLISGKGGGACAVTLPATTRMTPKPKPANPARRKTGKAARRPR